MITSLVNTYITKKQMKDSDFHSFLKRYPCVRTYFSHAYTSQEEIMSDLRTLFNQKIKSDKSLPNATSVGLLIGLSTTILPFLFLGTTSAALSPILTTVGILTTIGFLYEKREKEIASKTYRREIFTFAKETADAFSNFHTEGEALLENLSPKHQDELRQSLLSKKRPSKLISLS